MSHASVPPNAVPLSEIDAARRHLLLSFPTLEELQTGADAVDRLIEGACHHLRSGPDATPITLVTEVVQAIRELTGLAYDSAEIIASLERLERRSVVRFVQTDQRAFVFDDKRYRELCADHAYRQERIDAVRREWFDDLRLRHELSDDQLESLWSATERFTAHMMNTYGAEAAAFLYQSRDENGAGARDRFAQVLEQRMPSLDDYVDASLLDVARVEIPRFFNGASASRSDYLTHRLRGAFVFHLLSLDPSASELIRGNVSDKTFYLDTNFVYRLLGFGGPTKAYGPQAVVSMARALNCTLLVAGETEDEFLRKLRSEVRDLRRHPIQQAAYQRLIAEHPGDEYSFMQAFYREVIDGKIRTYDQFERKYENLEHMLTGYGIRIDKDAVLSEEEEKSDDFLDLQSAFNSWTQQQRHPDAVTHDAYMLRLIRAKRGRRDKTVGSVHTWLLTYDRGLTAFSVHKAKGDHLPVCLMGDDWLQVARPFFPRTNDYDQSFLAMLRYPVAFEDPNLVPLAHMVEALERLDAMKELPPAVIAGMVSNQTLLGRIRLAQDDGAVKALVEVEAARYAKEKELEVARLAQANQELHDRVEQLERVTGEYRTRHQSVEASGESAMRERDAAREEVRALRAQVGEVPTLLTRAREETEKSVTAGIPETVRAALEEERARGRARRMLLARWVGCGLLWIATVAGAIRILLRWPTTVTPTVLVILVISFGLVTHALWRIGRQGKMDGIRSNIADFLGIVGFVMQLQQTFAPAASSPASPAPSAGADPAGTGVAGPNGVAPQSAVPKPEQKTGSKPDSLAKDTVGAKRRP